MPFNEPIITLLFKDGTQAHISYESSTGDLTDDHGSLSNLDKVIANIKCNECGTITKATMEQIEDVSSDERQMGIETFYNITHEEKCKKCKNKMEIEIEITTYAYNIDFQNYNTSGCKLV